MQPLLDLGQTSPRALSPTRMSNECTKLCVENLYLGDFEVTRWQEDFVADMYTKSRFTLDQKKVIYNLARKFHIL